MSASEEAVPLPRSEPIPAEHESTAAGWVHVFGKELVSCLFSRDWAVRETGLRRLAHEVSIERIVVISGKAFIFHLYRA